MAATKRQQILGWTAVGLSTAIMMLWAFWGILENFHEGWHNASFWANLGLMALQYLGPLAVFLSLALIALRWPRVGFGLHLATAVFLAWFFNAFTDTVVLWLLVPLLLLGVLYGLGRPEPRRLAVAVLVGLPLLTLVGFGIEPAIRVAGRVDDGDRGARRVAGNGVTLVWAPAGPGWPEQAATWAEASRACAALDSTGVEAVAPPPGVWRLPTVDEAVRSMARHGVNSGGVWDPARAKAVYRTHPDKESPLWNTHSQIIYWWTATEVDSARAYIIVYDGKVWPKQKRYRIGSRAYRCVREA